MDRKFTVTRSLQGETENARVDRTAVNRENSDIGDTRRLIINAGPNN